MAANAHRRRDAIVGYPSLSGFDGIKAGLWLLD
jgi:hypothetical protein